MAKAKAKSGRLPFVLGCCCIILAVLLGVYNIYVSARAAQTANALTDNLAQLLEDSMNNDDAQTGVDPALLHAGETDISEMDALRVNGYDVVGQVTVPTAEINLAVISQWSYPNLAVAPCRYSGTPDNQLVLLAHNYKKHFGRLNVLVPGDQVLFTDVSGTVYEYEVTRIETWATDQLDQILGGEDWDLTLFTCTYSGNNRLVVRCSLQPGVLD